MDEALDMPSPIQSRMHVVLVEPGESLNIGSVARAMNNFGFTNLHLVAPARYDLERARVTACWSEDLLESAKIHPTLSAALAGMDEVVGFAGQEGKNKPPIVFLSDWVAGLANSSGRNIALLFGPEDTGLRLDHLELCSTIVRIPSTVECPSLNLAQAVMVSLYEISRGKIPLPMEPERELATWDEFEQLDRLVTAVCEQSGFYSLGTPEPLPAVVKSLFRRTNPSKREMKVMLGIFSNANKTLSGKRPVHQQRQPLKEEE